MNRIIRTKFNIFNPSSSLSQCYNWKSIGIMSTMLLTQAQKQMININATTNLNANIRITPKWLKNVKVCSFQSPSLKMNLLWHNSRFRFSTISPSIAVRKGYEYQMQLRKINKFQELIQFFDKNREDINKYGKTIILQFLLEFNVQIMRTTPTKQNLDNQIIKQTQVASDFKKRFHIYKDIQTMTNLNFYQKVLRYSFFRKLQMTVNSNQYMRNLTKEYRRQILQYQIQKLDIIDGLNTISSFFIEQDEQLFEMCCKLIDREILQIDEIPQKSGNIFLKRIAQGDWKIVRKYTNIQKYICFHYTDNIITDFGELIQTLKRLCSLKLHLVGPCTIPKKIDQIFDIFIEKLSQMNEYYLFSVFDCFNLLPINYNNKVFDLIKGHIMSKKQLSIKYLQKLPYERLTLKQIEDIQEKVLKLQGKNIAMKSIYFVDKSFFKKLFTPKMRKSFYYSMIDCWQNQTHNSPIHYSVYIGLIQKMIDRKESYPYIDHQRLKKIFLKIIDHYAKDNYLTINTTLSLSRCLGTIQTAHKFNVIDQINPQRFLKAIMDMTLFRKTRNKFNNFIQQVLECIMAYYNAKSELSYKFMAFLVNQVVDYNSKTDRMQLADICHVIFSIEKSENAKQRFKNIADTLFNSINPQDYPAFLQNFTKYDAKNWNLTNSVIEKMINYNIDLQYGIKMTCTLPLRFITMLNGSMNVALKNYLNKFMIKGNSDLLKNIHNNQLILLLRNISHFGTQAKQFANQLINSVINKISMQLEADSNSSNNVSGKCKAQDQINGKLMIIFASSSQKFLQLMTAKQKQPIIVKIAQILNKLRKSGKQGIFLKSFYLNYCYLHKQYVKADEDLLSHMSRQIVQTLQKTHNIQNKIDVFLIIMKLYCMGHVNLQNYQLIQFKNILFRAIQNNSTHISHINDVLGYTFVKSVKVNVKSEQELQKTKLIFGELIKFIYRRDQLKEKLNLFLQNFCLEFFSLIQSNEMIVQCVVKNLNLQAHSGYIRVAVSILNHNSIKNEYITRKIINMLLNSIQYKSFQKYQTYLWIEKVYYNPQKSMENECLKQFKRLKAYISQQMITLQQKGDDNGNNFGKNSRQVQNKYVEQNLKIFVDYGWILLKNKQFSDVSNKIYDFCLNNIDNIEEYMAMQQLNHKTRIVSKKKLSMLLKLYQNNLYKLIYNSKSQKNLPFKTEINQIEKKKEIFQKFKKYTKFLHQVHIEKCPQLEKYLTEKGIKFTYNKYAGSIFVEYYVQKCQLVKQQYTILTVKKYHETSYSEFGYQLSAFTKQISKKQQQLQEQKRLFRISKKSQPVSVQQPVIIQKKSWLSGKRVTVSNMQSQKLTNVNEKVPQTIIDRQSVKVKEIDEKYPNVEEKAPQTIIDRQSVKVKEIDDYNGSLQADKSLIQLLTDMKCVIFDPKTSKMIQ